MSNDPARQYWRQGHHKQDLAHRSFTDMPPPRDPVAVAAAEGRQHVNQATGTVLFHQNAMPCGPHRGKIMERVPAAELLRYADYARSLRVWPEWQPVLDYIDRHRAEIKARAQPTQPFANLNLTAL
ncbi:MAG: hypothetical protein ACOYMN_19760 [Roseimicrobium sp.]